MSFDLELTNGDLKIGTDGKIKTVTDTPKLRQDIIKIILTPLGSVAAHRWYGSSISDDIIGRNLPDHLSDAQIASSIEDALNNLKKLQFAQSTYQQLSLAEVIATVAQVKSERDIEDPRKIIVYALVLSKRMTKIQEYFTLTS